MKSMDNEWTEQELLRGITEGTESAFRYLFDNYYPMLVSFANRFVEDLDSSRNIVQDVFVGLYDKRKTIHIHTSLKAHLYQSVRNRALNQLKKEKMEREHHGKIRNEMDEQVNNDELLNLSELEGRISRVVNELPAKCREIFVMSRHEGVPNADIAKQLSISKRTVETQISNALKKIRTDLKKHGYLPFVILILGSIALLF
ncbi:RNA polymerase sigma-70 factor [Thermophagus sp. OGC60D27]|uniref:RNA polymerase sigma-70 factor n=1 Tax=Thermophagus sp. OGC60D27 TaxID=3458415 RepID=UPI0040382E73